MTSISLHLLWSQKYLTAIKPTQYHLYYALQTSQRSSRSFETSAHVMVQSLLLSNTGQVGRCPVGIREVISIFPRFFVTYLSPCSQFPEHYLKPSGSRFLALIRVVEWVIYEYCSLVSESLSAGKCAQHDGLDDHVCSDCSQWQWTGTGSLANDWGH